MKWISRIFARWSRLIRRLWVALFAFHRRIGDPVFRFLGPDILDVGSDGSIRVTRPAGAAPLRPRVVVRHPDFTNPRAQRLARRAAAFLFDHYDFVSVPAQFWPIFERLFDPGKAMDAFLRAVGCDPGLIRQRDPRELRKAGEVIELLVLSGDIFSRLAPEVRRIIGLELEFGNYDKIRQLAEVAAHLQTALEAAAPWSGKSVVASFADLLLIIQRMLDNPMKVVASEAATAVGLVVQFAAAQSRYDGLCDRFAALQDALRDVWPDAWRGTRWEDTLRTHVGNFENVSDSMRSGADLSLDQLNEGNEFLASNLRELEDLLENALGGGRAGTSGAGSTGRTGGRASSPPPPPDEVEIALHYFRFTKSAPPNSAQQLKSAWRARLKEVHPDLHPGASEDEIKRLNEQSAECTKHYNLLRAHFSWHRSA